MTVNLKPATFSDVTFLWFLRNQQDVYQYFEHPKPVTWEDHISWITPVLLKIEPKYLYIISYGKTPVGQLRFDYDKQQRTKINISLLKGFRGKGIARRAIALGINKIKKTKKIKVIFTLIHKDNTVSCILFEKFSFKKIGGEGNYIKYTLSL